MRLSIITINYNGSDNTVKLLRSLSAQTDKDFQIIIVDNASEKEDFEVLAAECAPHSNMTIVRNGQNLGFSGGNNVGIKKALEMGANWVLLLNNDTWVEEGFIGALKAILGPKRGILGLPLNEGEEVSYAGRVGWLMYPRGSHIHSFKKAISGDIYVIGGGMLIHKDVINKIGFLDEKYFLYFEDMDYSVRARRNGIPIEVLEGPVVYHNVSSSTKKLGSPTVLRYHYRNAFYFNLKNGRWYVRVLVWPWSFWIMKKQLFKIMLGYKEHESWAIFRGVIDFYKSRYGKI